MKSIRRSTNGSVRASQRESGMHGAGSIVSGQASSDLRRREVVLAKISLYMVFVLLLCHSVKIFPNLYEMYLTYNGVSCLFLTPEGAKSIFGRV